MWEEGGSWARRGAGAAGGCRAAHAPATLDAGYGGRWLLGRGGTKTRVLDRGGVLLGEVLDLANLPGALRSSIMIQHTGAATGEVCVLGRGAWVLAEAGAGGSGSWRECS